MEQQTIDRVQSLVDEYTLTVLKRRNIKGISVGNINAQRDLGNIIKEIEAEIMQILFDDNKKRVENHFKKTTI